MKRNKGHQYNLFRCFCESHYLTVCVVRYQSRCVNTFSMSQPIINTIIIIIVNQHCGLSRDCDDCCGVVCRLCLVLCIRGGDISHMTARRCVCDDDWLIVFAAMGLPLATFQLFAALLASSSSSSSSSPWFSTWVDSTHACMVWWVTVCVRMSVRLGGLMCAVLCVCEDVWGVVGWFLIVESWARRGKGHTICICMIRWDS